MSVPRAFLIACFISAGVVVDRPLDAQERTDTTADGSPPGSAGWVPHVLGTQINVIAQWLAPFHSPYAGSNSLTGDGDQAISHVYGVYLGARPVVWAKARTTVEAYLDAEMVRGRGVGHTVGLGGLTNGDVIRQGSADLGSGPYVARVFVRVVHALGVTAAPPTTAAMASDGRDAALAALDTLPRAPDQLPSVVSARRIELTAGKLAASDLFDVNRYANSTRQQFMNWALFQNTAWDFAADTRGYTNGLAVAWITPRLDAEGRQLPDADQGKR
jgi:hypothetical protein